MDKNPQLKNEFIQMCFLYLHMLNLYDIPQDGKTALEEWEFPISHGTQLHN